MSTKLEDRSIEWLDQAVEMLGRSGQRGTLRVQGRSMLPILREGRQMLVDFSATGFRRGELILFRMGEYLVVHRLLDDEQTER